MPIVQAVEGQMATKVAETANRLHGTAGALALRDRSHPVADAVATSAG
jgi:hypothetical protein